MELQRILSMSEARPTGAEAEPAFGLGDVVNILRRRARVLVGVAAVAALLVFLSSALQDKQYASTASIMINPSGDRVVSQDQALQETQVSSPVVDSEIEILKSRRLIEEVSEALKLAADPDWNGAARRPGPLDPLRALLGGGDAERPADSEIARSITRELSSRYSVRRRGLSYVIEVTARGDEPEEAARIANAVVAAYFAIGFDQREQSANRASGWLTERLEELRADVIEKERAIESYRVSAGLLSTEGSLLSEEQAVVTQTAMLSARADLAEAEARLAQVESLARNGSGVDTIAAVVRSETIRDLRTQEASLLSRLGELENRYGPQHPNVQSARAEMANVERQIAAEVSRIVMSLRNDAEIARARLATLEGNLNNAQGRLAQSNSALVRLRELQRDAEAAQGVYEDFLKRYYEIVDQGKLSVSQSKVISDAAPDPDPVAPDLRLALILSLSLGLVAGALAALVVDRLDDRIMDADDVRRALGRQPMLAIPLLAEARLRSLSAGQQNPAGYVVANPMSSFTEMFRVLRASISEARSDGPMKVVVITSSLAGEGKTTTSLCLARVAAQSGQRVLLVDCDLRRRTLNDLLGVEPAEGLLDVLAGRADWRVATGEDPQSGAHILALSKTAVTPRDVFGGEAMRALVAEWRRVYDFVILDCAPVLAVAETRTLAGLADGVVLIVRSQATPRAAASGSLAQLDSMGARVVGVVLNGVDPRRARAGRYGAVYDYVDRQRAYYREGA